MRIRYMDYACMGRPAPSTLSAVAEAIRKMSQWELPGTAQTLKLFEEVEQARIQAAEMLGVKSKHIALVNNTTHGLGTLASGLQLEKHHNVVIPDTEFMSSTLVWQQAQKIRGFDIRKVVTSNGQVGVKDFESVMDRNTKVLVVSAVQEVSGYRTDLQGLYELAESNQAFLMVDGIQELGVLPRNLIDTPVHAYCAGGHKWLGNPFGLGIMYVHPALAENCHPSFDGYLNVHEPKEGWDSYLQSRTRTAFDSFIPLEEARKYEPSGTPNWMGAVGLRAAVQEIQEKGMDLIAKSTLQLTERLKSHLKTLGLQQYILGGSESIHCSGIVTFSLPGGLEQERRLLGKLEAEGIYVSLRSIGGIGGIRVSPYYCNTMEDVDKLAEMVEGEVKK
ncbi:aminotransferase class V-fold PLP-dependent enzyme [Ammoniphilus sp. CFH 90114]|uniref:aminotransferase class V-fold PLP-dependent enzyme n=1 Tax=Ammoniphilus sp. CFH 90114 TaxID=2493665 RepID=UPI00100F9F9B|nr:aminotransferase class V-fold PLP-dependent enzyme [Ammoniphilus sp. CFH 90114]RXT08021.1 aminotransferase class V-fold PLP-dependent enzyme [Ammoniphilus sp. CFH 90114]